LISNIELLKFIVENFSRGRFS